MLLQGLVAELEHRGIELEADGDKLKFRPVEAAADLREHIREHKPALIALLSAVRPATAEEVERARWTADPRPELDDDSQLWPGLLSLAFDIDGDDSAGLFGGLHGLRCCGARLVSANGRLRLTAGALGAEYQALRRQYLVPNTEPLKRLMTALGRAVSDPVVQWAIGNGAKIAGVHQAIEVAMARALEPAEREAAEERELSGRPSVKFTEGEAMEKIAAYVGMSRPTLGKAIQVVEAAEADASYEPPAAARRRRNGNNREGTESFRSLILNLRASCPEVMLWSDNRPTSCELRRGLRNKRI